ncbi:hypothetical protein [Chryseobacterium fistulae]|uniref:Uncharacterized protein n=1 Tax=Chryseobacterium fistulae TaxID=2675058 RepID=A0A6N4XLT2_9FLAO|nr:hypothetical protein [Chryseobacterium fistulae]CAA7386143.1 hypothetical protein CHRY9393_00434 [Chryseobacterium fistulae]
MLAKQNQNILKAKGLVIYGNGENKLNILKPKGVPGNFLPEDKQSQIPIRWGNREFFTDSPVINIEKNEDIFSIICWDWTPGPGPGDFRIEVNSETEVVDFVINFYFEENIHFEAYKKDITQNRNSINVTDIKNIFEKLIQQLENKFSKSEINFSERGTFHKIPIDKWKVNELIEEKTHIEIEMGFIKLEVSMLRKKIDENKEFDQKDLTYIADLINELSFTMKK